MLSSPARPHWRLTPASAELVYEVAAGNGGVLVHLLSFGKAEDGVEWIRRDASEAALA